jgi:tetratricopeptide (TPR) repeat protein
MTIYGLGGCGKSALALEFVYRTQARHAGRLVFWVPAISQESFELAYREIGNRLRIPGITDENADVKGLVKKALSSDSVGQWLMVVDNADDPEVLIDSSTSDSGSARLLDYLPYSSRGKILFTTRSRKAAGDLTQNSVLELHDMSKAEAWQLLSRRITKQVLMDDERAVKELLDSLAYLPLAIVQAAAFINNNDISVSGYISLFREAGTKIELFGEQFEDPSRYREMESTIAKTWHISFEQIRRQEPLAAEYLSFIACIDRINIPQSLLPPAGSPIQQIKAVGTLKGYAFITERQQALQELESEKLFDMHRLVHMASEWWLKGHNKQTAWTAKAAARLEELIPYGGHERKEVWTRYLSHALHVAELDGTLEETVRASVLDRVGQCQSTLGQYSAAVTTHQQALLLRKKVLGIEHLDTLTSMSNLALVLDRQGKYEEAESINRQTLARREKVLGTEHPDTLTSMSNLALLLYSQGKYEEAESMNRQTLARREKVLGAEHPDTLTSMNNLAGVLDSQGKYEEAESINRQTLARCEKVLGAEHSDTLGSMNNLALVLDSQGKYEEAESINRQTLARCEKVLGTEHPHTLTSMSNLALVLDRQGKYEEAESINRQTLARREKVLGAEHPDTLTSMSNLALVLDSQGKYEEAESINRQTLARFEKVLGAEHPGTLVSMSNLALVLDKQGKYEKAESINRQTLARREKVLGAEHPNTLTSLYCLAHLLTKVRRIDESVVLYKRACAGYSAVLGEDHPTTRACRNDYSELLTSLEKDQHTLLHKTPDCNGSTRTGRESNRLRRAAKSVFSKSIFSRK